LPDQFWDFSVHPQFRDIDRLEHGKSNKQAMVLKELIANPLQLMELPRRWRLAAYSSPIEYATLTIASIVKEAIRSRIRVKCVPPSKLDTIQPNITDLVFCYGIYSDMDPILLNKVREAHMGQFHFFYAMESVSLIEAIKILKISPDYAFQVHACNISKVEKTI
jgi:hypothetical protein